MWVLEVCEKKDSEADHMFPNKICKTCFHVIKSDEEIIIIIFAISGEKEQVLW